MSEQQLSASANTERLEKLFRQNCHQPWEQAIEPIQLSPHVFYVGGNWVGTTLIDTGDGLILIDCGMPYQLYTIFEGIRKLGYDPRDIRKILVSHGHFDHVGAAKAVIEYTKAKSYGAKEDLAAFEGTDLDALRVRGQYYNGFTPDEFFDDNKPIVQGDITIRTMRTAGHTSGTTSFFFEDKDEKGNVYRLGMHGGLGLNTLTANSPEDMDRVRAVRKMYRSNMQILKAIPVDIVCSNHPAMANICERAAKVCGKTNPFYDPDAWNEMLDRYLAMLDSLEAQEP